MGKRGKPKRIVWERFFAWYPVRVDGRWRWLRLLERTRRLDSGEYMYRIFGE